MILFLLKVGLESFFLCDYFKKALPKQIPHKHVK